MSWFKRIAPPLLVVAAVIVVLVTLLTEHDDEYGRTVLPAGGVVTLPEGSVKVFVEQADDDGFQRRLSAPLRFEVTSVDTGDVVSATPTSGSGDSEVATQRSQEFGASGSVAKLDVPSAGAYAVSGGLGGGLSSRIPVDVTFGTDPFSAVLRDWHLWGGLIGGAILISLMPMPRRYSEPEEIAPAGTYLPPPYNG